MKKLSQQNLMDTAFILSVEHEELLLKKYTEAMDNIDNKRLKKEIKELKETSKEHVKLIKDLMIQLNLQS
ncbi:MAG: hypothetical protein N4A68_00730 [Maledivibacter sp.]|jgi:ABC-type phosphate transport system ATPase subunit|nr:hypothetical protein [Maledivibacter sp.]